MEGISVLNSRLPENIKAVTVVENKNNFCIILNDFYDEKTRNGFIKDELDKIKILRAKN